MKVKYSNQVKAKISKDTLQECLLLSFSLIPRDGLHTIRIKSDKEKMCFTQTSSSANAPFIILRKNINSLSINETICIYHTRDIIYVFMIDELDEVDI